MQRWNKRVALVTGASSEIGAALCKKLVDRGLTVIGCARDADKVEALFPENQVKKDGGKLHAMKCNLTEKSERCDMFKEIREKYGRLDLVVYSPLLQALEVEITKTGETKDWREMFFEVNFLHLFFFNQEALELMWEKEVKRGQEGQMIHIISSPADLKFKKYTTRDLYHSDLLVGFPRPGIQRNTDKSPIRVASLCTSYTEREFLSGMLDPETANTIYECTRSLKPEDVAEAVECILQVPPNLTVSEVHIRKVYGV